MEKVALYWTIKMNIEDRVDRSPPKQLTKRRFPFPTFVLQPILRRIVTRIAKQHPELFDRLGPHTRSTFVIDPIDFPFALCLQPDPTRPSFKAVPKSPLPDHEARIAGKFLTLLRLVDADVDGDALFFSRDLIISGNTEAVVSLRNALDDVDASIAVDVAEMFGPLGRFALTRCRKIAESTIGTEA